MAQTLLTKPETVDQIKEDMLAGRYDYQSRTGQIGGWRDSRGNYYIGEGHHRINAALEIYWETGDREPLDRLLRNGDWKDSKPPKNRRLPTRSFWTRVLYILHRLGF